MTWYPRTELAPKMKHFVLCLAAVTASLLGFANPSEGEAAHPAEAEKEFNPTEMIMHHIADAHEFHVYGDDHNGLTIPLPIILYTNQGLVTFSSGEFHHDDEGKVVVEKNGQRFVKAHEKIYYASETPNEHGAFVEMDEEHHVVGEQPYDFSITKNVASLLLSAFFILLLFLPLGSKYKKNGTAAPSGIQSFLEPLVLFVRDDIAIPNIGEKKASKYMPYLLTIFFFIWINNLIGLIPFFPFGSNLTGNIAFTFTMAVVTLIVTNFSGNKDYWGHIFNTPGVPWWLKFPVPLMPLVEFAGVVAKPFALMIRLFANISAGHIIILSLISLIFIFQSLAIAPVSAAFVLFMNVLELLVAALQAYIFTLLTALFIGSAVAEHEHEHEGHH
ncbi:MAG TPA: F0F1 ATP synthase subunit A [Luteibaculaceae bacterium]|nr:F0F1 ATP synthase subunit A [Luteibaculaceae bacterium]